MSVELFAPLSSTGNSTFISFTPHSLVGLPVPGTRVAADHLLTLFMSCRCRTHQTLPGQGSNLRDLGSEPRVGHRRPPGIALQRDATVGVTSERYLRT